MIAVIQRARDACVRIDNAITGQIGYGLVILLGVCQGDQIPDAEFLAHKIAHLRIFPDSDDKMNLSLLEVRGSALVISQFTLCADWRKGRRPSFNFAADPELGEHLYLLFTKCLRAAGIHVETGRFGAMMQVHLVNDGPVTFVIDSRLKQTP